MRHPTRKRWHTREFRARRLTSYGPTPPGVVGGFDLNALARTAVRIFGLMDDEDLARALLKRLEIRGIPGVTFAAACEAVRDVRAEMAYSAR